MTGLSAVLSAVGELSHVYVTPKPEQRSIRPLGRHLAQAGAVDCEERGVAASSGIRLRPAVGSSHVLSYLDIRSQSSASEEHELCLVGHVYRRQAVCCWSWMSLVRYRLAAGARQWLGMEVHAYGLHGCLFLGNSSAVGGSACADSVACVALAMVEQ